MAKIQLTLFGVKVEMHDDFSIVPPYSKSNTKIRIRIHQDPSDLVVYLCPDSMDPLLLKASVSKLAKAKPEERGRIGTGFLDANGTLRQADTVYGETFLIGVLIATVTASDVNSNATVTIVAYAPNIVDTTKNHYIPHNTYTNRDTKKIELQQIHFEAISTAEVEAFIKYLALSSKDIEAISPSMFFAMEYYFKGTTSTPPVCGSCESVMKGFFEGHKGHCSHIHGNSPKLDSKTDSPGKMEVDFGKSVKVRKPIAPQLPRLVYCPFCKEEKNFDKVEPSKIVVFHAPNSNTAQVYCPKCKTLLNYPA